MINLNCPIQTHKHMTAALIMDSNSQSNVRRKTLSQKVEVGITSLVFVTFTLITIISLVFLAHSNRNATKGYALKNLEIRRSQLMTENEVWDMQIAQVKSLASIENDPSIKRMVKADKPMFVRGDTAIASR